jgi:hypothetical protein
MTSKKLQVFVSSTYKDLREERQAAVEAILTAGHIPAGMELFAAGNQSQLEVIKQWIKESDVFLLILGGRYGTIEAQSGKSYIQLEYEHAQTLGMPYFAVVITEDALDLKVRGQGREVLEEKNPEALRKFRGEVLGKHVRFWDDTKDIKLAILETLSKFSTDLNLVGWIRSDRGINGAAVAEELARLGRENSELRSTISEAGPRFSSGLTFSQMKTMLKKRGVSSSDVCDQKHWDCLVQIAEAFGDGLPNLLHVLWAFREVVLSSEPEGRLEALCPALKTLIRLGIFRHTGGLSYDLAPDGRSFLLRLELEMGDAVPAVGFHHLRHPFLS